VIAGRQHRQNKKAHCGLETRVPISLWLLFWHEGHPALSADNPNNDNHHGQHICTVTEQQIFTTKLIFKNLKNAINNSLLYLHLPTSKSKRTELPRKRDNPQSN